MMKRFICVWASLAAILAACQKEPVQNPSSSDLPLDFEASIEALIPYTKTSMTSDGRVVWSKEDQIAIFQGKVLADRYKVEASGAGKSKASFEYADSNGSVDGNFSAGTEFSCNVAVYPYSDGLSLDVGRHEAEAYTINGMVLPSIQMCDTDSFTDGTFPMVAVSKEVADHDLSFKNALGAIRFQLKGTQTVMSIKVEGKNKEKLSGPVALTAYPGDFSPVVEMTGSDSASESVTLDCGKGVQLSETDATDFIIALPPVLFEKGFTVTVTYLDHEPCEIEYGSSYTITRSSTLVMPEFSIAAKSDNVGPYRRVLLLYAAGFNSLSSYLKGDIQELKKGAVPLQSDDDVLLVYSHFPTSGYGTPSSPTLSRLTRLLSDEVTEQTLVSFTAGTISSSAEQLEQVLALVQDKFPAESYGMIFSSHATGYLPIGFYQNPDDVASWTAYSSGVGRKLMSVPYIESEYDPYLPAVKSVGQDQVGTSGKYVSYEMNIDDFAEAIPMHLDYLLFDACLMGGIEVAYELKEKVGKVGFSQAEILADGFFYEKIPTHLLGDGDIDLVSVCSDFFDQYDKKDGVYRSATISLIDCEELNDLAGVCKSLFEAYSSELDAIVPSKVQRFFRSKYHWFYDLESIIINAGISEAELSELHAALDRCVIYKAHTPMFMNEFAINTFSGFSMYLPCDGSSGLNDFYKTLQWNLDTGLVR